MTYVMTATPIAMLACGYLFTNTTSVIQWHVLGMFVPSFFTGHLIARFGVLQIMMVGAGMLVAAVLVNQSGIELMHFYAGLVLLGLGWNFLYIGGSTLLTQSYQPLEKAKVQGVFDTLIFATAASGSILAGMIQEISGWQTVNQGVLPLIAIAIGLIVWMLFLQRRPAS
jgi:MFS family permease